MVAVINLAQLKFFQNWLAIACFVSRNVDYFTNFPEKLFELVTNLLKFIWKAFSVVELLLSLFLKNKFAFVR